ncbi:MAG: hypothetical protein ABSE05_12120 [Syntrophales bacterium]|jgi:hypothetical protein
MKHSKRFATVCILSVIFLLVASQPILAVERTIRMVVPGCE